MHTQPSMLRSTHKSCPSEGGTEQSPAPVQHCFFVPKKGTQRHCDHLEGVKNFKTDLNERKIERDHVARFLKERVSRPSAHGYWEVFGQPTGDDWLTLIQWKTFELLVQCPPGKSITYDLPSFLPSLVPSDTLVPSNC